ncbi:Holliday junction resolvase RuvX [Ruminiclostridium cellobioparum]|uniref:Putative pre-16S rRNA nuclease n=1 Tax=Ruminiclostridium cellobioparum subsp. termitidis CT1112 TaxID=1195236 RepID=S0FFZ0_RUMCE|nr:Holliday junction resolvase RuvX [Ruminiclostridium cellobioparum]EMS69687.1 RNAse H-fold protein YqgF [Ruminiclostridium cellobioparum subsp. termitidis CT1112]
MRVLGIDYGDSRIGVAVSDPMGWTAQGLETVKSKDGLRKAIERLMEIIKQYEVKDIVIGYPLNMNGTAGPRAERTEAFIKKLLELGDFNIVKWDERLTTVSAHRAMNELGIKASNKKNIVDTMSAVFILQGYLDRQSRNNI